jgi:hypothetical protein
MGPVSFFGVKGYKDHLGLLEYYKFFDQNLVNLLRKFHNPAPCIYLLVHEYSGDVNDENYSLNV